MDALSLRRYETLSPFEIKNDLARLAVKTAKATQAADLNAGRGNPNWIATAPRAMNDSSACCCLRRSEASSPTPYCLS